MFDPPRPAVVAAREAGEDRRVALLCGGLSLPEHWNAEVAKGYDLVVAVNGACFRFACDYAVIVDSPVVRRLLKAREHHPRVALVTYARAYGREARQAGVQLRMAENIPANPDGSPRKSYSMPRALMFALKLCGPGGVVDVFGCDMSDGGHDVAGLNGDHGPIRWKQEADCLRLVWDARRVERVFGQLRNDRLEYLRGERTEWPG